MKMRSFTIQNFMTDITTFLGKEKKNKFYKICMLSDRKEGFDWILKYPAVFCFFCNVRETSFVQIGKKYRFL